MVAKIQSELQAPSPDIFKEAQAEVFTLMEQDVFPRFVKSEGGR